MKKVIAFAAFAVLLAACSNVGKYKPMIEELSANWDNTTSSVTDFVNQVTTVQSDMASMNKDLNVDAAVMENWDEATQSQFSQIQSTASTSMKNLSGLSSEVDAFMTSWQEKSQELQALKDGLETGKLEGDVQGKIASLTAAANDASSKLEGWQTKLAEINASAANAKQMLADFMQNTESTSGVK